MKRILAAFAALVMIVTGVVMMQPASATGAVPNYDHIVVVVMENESSTNIIGSSQAPYINSMANTGVNLADAHGEAHPSQPNYLALFSGSTQGVTDDSSRTFSGPNLSTQLTAAGKTFVGYSEGKNTGTAWKAYHSPWLHWTGTPTTAQQDWTAFPTDYNQLPNVAIVVPDACHDMHDCSISTGDTWLQQKLDAYRQWAKTHNSLLIVTFDEDGGVGGTTSANKIATVMDGDHLNPGGYSGTVNHYGMLGMMEDANGLPRLNNAVGAFFPTSAFNLGTTQVVTPTPTPTPTATQTPVQTATPTPTPTTSTTTPLPLPDLIPVLLTPLGGGQYKCSFDYPDYNTPCELSDGGSADNVVRLYPDSTQPGMSYCSITFTGRSTRPCFITTHG